MSAYTDLVVDDGAAGFWPLDDAATPFASAVGGPSLALATGTATPQSVTLAAGLAPTISLAGSISDASLPAGTFNGAADFTLEAWLSPSAAQSTVPILLGDGNNGVGLFVAAPGGPPGLLLQGLLANVSLVPSAVTAVVGTAYHLVLQFKAGIGVQMYVDGVASGSAVGAGPIAPSALTQSQFNGDIGYLAVYPTALTPTQINDHYTAGATAPPVDPPALDAGHLVVHGGTITLLVTNPPALDAGHTAVHGGTLAMTASTVVVDAGHLAAHGGTLNTFVPAYISAGHTVIHGGVIVSDGTPPIGVSSDGLAGGEWADGVVRDLAPQPPEPGPIVVPLPTWANR